MAGAFPTNRWQKNSGVYSNHEPNMSWFKNLASLIIQNKHACRTDYN